MQHKAVYLLFWKFTLNVSCVNHIHHQEPPVLVIFFCAATSLQRGQASFATLDGGSCTVPEAVVTVLLTPDGGCDGHPKYVD